MALKRPLLFISLLVLLFAGRVSADGSDLYRLVAGDTVQILYPGSATAVTAMIDIDGQVRLPGLRGLGIADLTLDEAELFVETALSEAGLFVDPSTSISVARYAPVVVAGHASNQGQYDFFPGMTVSAALGLAGGSISEGPGALDLAQAETAARSRLRQAANEIADGTVKLAGLDAFLEDRDAIDLTPSQISAIPATARERLPELIAAETRILEARIERSTEMLRIWESEIDGMEAQSQISTQRLALQNQIVANAEAELEASRTLVDRGLQTSSRHSELTDRDASARARSLEIENAKILLDRSISEALVEKFSFVSLERLDALRERRLVNAALLKAKTDHAREVETLATLALTDPVSAFANDNFQVKFDILSPRVDRTFDGPIEADTPLMPADTLIVTIVPVDQFIR